MLLQKSLPSFLILSIASIDLASAFVLSVGNSSPRCEATPLNLVPEEGHLLLIYSEALHAEKAKESAAKASKHTSSRRLNTDSLNRSDTNGPSVPGNFVTRLLGVGGSLYRNAASLTPSFSARGTTALSAVHNVDDDLDADVKNEEESVMYPLVGFNLVDGHALPNVHQSAACALHLEKDVLEDVVGWYRHEDDNDILD